MQLLSPSHMASDVSLPSLTDPDMILPYKSHLPNVSPSPPRKFQRPPSPPSWRNDASDGHAQMKRAMRHLFGNGHSSRDPDADAATLRDEDSNSKIEDRSLGPTQRTSLSSVLPSSPTLHDDYDLKNESDAVSEGVDEDHWEGFDSPAVDGEISQYQASNGEKFKAAGDREYGFPQSAVRVRGGLDEDENDPYSHAAMSIRAEQILANAKKRLITMEGNLSRARSNLNSRPSSSMSSFTSCSSDQVSLYTIPGGSNGGISAAKHRQPNSINSSGGNKGHSRVYSETSIPSVMQSASHTEKPQRGGARASSAMGSNGMGPATQTKSGEPGSGPARNWFWTGLTRNGSYTGQYNGSLQPLHEDEPAPESFRLSHSKETATSSDEKSGETNDERHPSEAAAFDIENPPTTGLTRARSTTQMRDLRDQMQELKGRLSSLKQRAREDNMRRRSLQSLRTPSPFTAAEQWYTGSPGARNVQPQAGFRVTPPIAEAQENVEMVAVDEIEPLQSVDEDDKTHVLDEQSPNEVSENSPQRNTALVDAPWNDHEPEVGTIIEGPNEPFLVDHETTPVELNDEIDGACRDQNYQGSPPPSIGERHEDRADAFDYEHFFLHSGIGSDGPTGLSRSSSRSSMYSVETTKPANATIAESEDMNDAIVEDSEDAGQEDTSIDHKNHSRQDSAGSISTVATFATATEGNAPDGDEDEWIHQHSIVDAWRPVHSTEHKHGARSNVSSPENQRAVQSMKHSATIERLPTNGTHMRSTSLTERSIPTPMSPGTADRSSSPSPVLHLLSSFLPTSSMENGTSDKALLLRGSDKELVERLAKSLSKVCDHLHHAGTEGSKYEGRAWRRRLDAARRVLDGEINGEVF